ncbi:BTAD domain-containing putative transcriptional regulator [Microbacterium sp. 2FI]|uniref:nSTAND1 domain-containing NTPase n=1 Tax=Microbacterium sp. 2FI TaxID=2502193 RepID=UPI0010F9DD1A|nr:BTAD domain-containing putative transcriptional regulator [Microbacterium sp. 2FI]
MAIKVLGPMDTGEQALGPRERAILAALIVRRGSTLAPSELAEAWWGENPPATWAQQIRNSVARIRSRVGRDAVETVSTDYRLGLDPESIDAVRFERLVSDARGHELHGDHDRSVDTYRRALALWRGAPLQDVAAWEPGVVEAMRLAQIRACAEEELLDARLRAGEHRAVIPDAERLVREEPLREDRWAILALANYRADRQAEALATLRAARERLDEELGIEPGARLTALETAMLRQDPILDAPAASAEPSAECPYPGLRAFSAADADLFFGRESDADAIIERLRPGAIVTIAGPSGTGKSSLALAGVVSRVRASGRTVETLVPGADAATALRNAGARAAVVVVDQAEDILRHGEDVRARFGGAAAELLDDGRALLVTVRSDGLDGLRAIPEIGDAIGRSIYLLGPMSTESFREAIEQPALRAGLRIEPGLTELALRDLGDRAATLPHFSHALRETWLRREGSTLTVEGYEASGGIAGSIAQSAEDAYRSLQPTEQAVCRSLLLRLIDRSDDGTSTRRRMTSETMLADPERRRVLEALARARLVSIDDAAVMVTHEAVATAWPRLDDWLAEDADRSRVVRVIESAAAGWVADGRSDEDLLRGARLHLALDLRDGDHHDLTPVELEFLEASAARERSALHDLEERSARERARNRTLQFSLRGVAALLVAVVIAAAAAIVQRQQADTAAEDARIEAIVATSLAQRAGDRDVAALLAAEAYRRWPDDDRVRSALFGIMTGAGGLVRQFVHQASTAAVPLPDGNGLLVVVDTEDSATVQVLDIDSGAVMRTIDVDLPPATTRWARSVAVSPDGRVGAVQTGDMVKVGSEDLCCVNDIVFFDLTTGATLPGSQLLDLRTTFVLVFSDDGSRLNFGNPITQDLQSIDVRTGSVRASSPEAFEDHVGEDGISDGLAVLPDGLIAVGSPEAVILYDAATTTEVRRVPTPGDLSTSGVIADGAGGVVSAGLDGAARIDLDSGEVLWTAPDVPGRLCQFVATMPAYGTAYCSRLGSVTELNLETGLPTGRELPTLVDEAVRMTPHGDDTLILHAADASKTLVWSLDGTGPASRMVARGRKLVGGLNGEGTLAVTADDEKAQLWNLETDQPVGDEADWLAWISPDVVERWSEEDGAALISVDGTGSWFSDEIVDELGENIIPVAAPPGRHAFALAEGSPVFVAFDPATGERIGPFLRAPDVEDWFSMIRVSESIDGTRTAITFWDEATQETRMAVFNQQTGEVLAHGLAGTEGSVIIGSDELITAGDDALTRRHLDTLEPIDSLPKPFSSGTSAQVSDDGRTMLVVGWDNRAALYGLERAVKLGDTIDAAGPEVSQGAQLSRDGDRLVTNGPDGILVWDIDPDHQAKAACEIVGRELTALEWETYFGDEQVATCAEILG